MVWRSSSSSTLRRVDRLRGSDRFAREKSPQTLLDDVAREDQEIGQPPVGVAELGAIIRRRWVVIAGTTLLFTLLGLFYALTTKSIYTASTAIFVDPRNRPSFQIEGTGTGAGYDPNLVDSQTIVIESDAVLRRVIAAEKLLEDAEFTRGPGDASFNALRNLKQAIKVKRPDRTYVVEIAVQSEDAQKAARIANAVARAYLSDGRDSKNETASREQNWLDTHLADLQARLKDAEARVDAYKAENRIVGADGKLVGEQQLSELNRLLVDTQRKAAEAKATLDQVEEHKRSGRMPDSTADALKSPVIDRLRGQMAEILRLEANSRTTLGPRHPASLEIREQIAETRRAINEELARIAEGAKSAHSVASKHVAALEKQLEGLKRDTTSTNRTLLRLRELERAVDAQKAVYEKFLRDKEQIARLTVDTPAGRVIAPAVAPQGRSFPNRPLILMLAFVGGLFVGIGLALLVETLSAARKSKWQSRSDLSPTGAQETATLAVLPRSNSARSLRWVNGARSPTRGIAPDMVARSPALPYSREIRRLAAEILDMLGTQRPVTLMISGARPEAGSPVLSSNLAHALAELGARVLLVDGSGTAKGLTALLARKGKPCLVEAAGQQRVAFRLPSQHGEVCFLPFGGITPNSRQHLPQANPATLILIDGPAIDTPALTKIDIRNRVDGVIAVLPPGADPANSALAGALDKAFGGALIGVIAQAA